VDTILDVHGLRKEYEGFTLGDVSFSLPRGYIMGLIGANGAGKTTLIKSILGVVRPSAGAVSVFGLDSRVEGARIRSRVGFVLEAPSFPAYLTLRRLAAMVGSFYPRWNRALFRELAADFELPLGKVFHSISRGMRTRFVLALAMSHSAELLLLDEPTSGLDPVFRRRLLERLSAYIGSGESSVLFSTQITSDLERTGDFITMIDRGRLVFSSTRDEMLERWAVVKGGLDLLDEEARRFFKGLEVRAFSFSALTDDAGAARRRFASRGAIVERASLEDVMFFVSRHAEDGGMTGHARGGRQRMEAS
jgi:ABC-2 type transport system ATP-binding protein